MSLSEKLEEKCVISSSDTFDQLKSSELRERYLLFLKNTIDKQAVFKLHGGKTNVSGCFQGCDFSITDFYIRDLHTPVGLQMHALLRCYDIISFHVINNAS